MARWLLLLPVLLFVSAGLGALGDAFPGQPFPAQTPAAPALNAPPPDSQPSQGPAAPSVDDGDDEPTPT